MKTLTVDLPGRAYDIHIERGVLARSGELCRSVLPRARRLALVSLPCSRPALYSAR